MFAVLHLPDFALQAVVHHERDLAPQPVALFSETAKKSVALALNPAAARSGVVLGMTAPQAIARCPTLVIRSPRPEFEHELRALLLTVGFTLSPQIEDTAPGVCTADLRGSPPAQHLPLATAALTQLHACALRASAGLGRTPLLALYAARAAQPLLHVADDRAFLASLPVSAADPSPQLAEILKSWGVRTLGQVSAISCESFVRRFGTEGLAFWQRATGGSARPLKPYAPTATFTAKMEFEETIETLEPLLFILRRFLDRLALELQAAQFVAGEIFLTLRFENDLTHARQFRLPEPTADVEILFRTLSTHLETVHADAAVAAVELHLMPVRPLVRQQGLFEAGLRDPHGFAETLARAASLVGTDRIGTPQPLDTHRPDAFQLVTPPAVVPPPRPAPIHPSYGLPLQRFRPPLPARVGLLDGQPSFLWSDWVSGEITRCSHASLTSGEWWETSRSWSREEVDVELALGGLYRIFQQHGAWFLEGEYS